MINKSSIKSVEAASFGAKFIKPLYDSYSFSNIIGTIEYILTGKSDKHLPLDVLETLGTNYDKVVLLFVDALGWRFIEPRLQTSEIVKKLEKKGVLSKLTSIFPSTTSAAVPVINTGMEPVETELIEWRQYNNKVDDIIIPIKFKHGYNRKIDLKGTYGLEPVDIYPANNIYHKLNEYGVKSITFMGDSYADSEFNKALTNGAEMFPYFTLDEALYGLSEKLINRIEGKHFMHLYVNYIDDIAHKYGAGSPELDIQIDNVFRLIDELILQRTEGKIGKTLLLITADHGHDVFDPEKTIYINKLIPDFEKYLRRNSRNEPILPSGSAKDVFLHINPELLEEVRNKLEEVIDGLGEVHLSKDLLEQGFFGTTQPSERFKNIIGDLVLLPYSGQSIWWYQGEKYLKTSKGQHGGLSRYEMEIPLFAYPL
jgi:hypothetical protein